MHTISSTELRDNKTRSVDRTKQEVALVRSRHHESFVAPSEDRLPEDFDRALSMDEAITRIEAGMRRIIERHKRACTSK